MIFVNSMLEEWFREVLKPEDLPMRSPSLNYARLFFGISRLQRDEDFTDCLPRAWSHSMKKICPRYMKSWRFIFRDRIVLKKR